MMTFRQILQLLPQLRQSYIICKLKHCCPQGQNRPTALNGGADAKAPAELNGTPFEKSQFEFRGSMASQQAPLPTHRRRRPNERDARLGAVWPVCSEYSCFPKPLGRTSVSDVN